MVQFLDHAPRYRKEKIYRKATANTTAYINYPAGRYLFDEEYGNNRSEIDKVLEAINKLTYTGELVMDSIDMTATASPGRQRGREPYPVQAACRCLEGVPVRKDG